MVLDEIRKALEEVDPLVFYGQAGKLDGGDIWDYIVFSRDSLSVTGNNSGFTDTYRVAIVREEFVPDADVYAVIDAMLSIPGMRLAGNEFTYEYAAKPNTNTVCELLVIDFVKPRKRND